MAPAHGDFEKGLSAPEMDSGSDKARVQEIDTVGREPGIIAVPAARRFEAPEFIRNWTPEERQHAERRLKAKIDLRLMPMIILMYIMNYLDRVGSRGVVSELLLILSEQYCGCQTCRHSHGFEAERVRIQCTSSRTTRVSVLTMKLDICQYPVCRIPSHASTFKFVLEQNREAITLPPNLHDCLGWDLSCYGSLQELWWSHCMSDSCLVSWKPLTS